MLSHLGSDLVSRWEGNPLITIEDLSFRCNDICNAGAVKFDGEYILLVTIQTPEGFNSIYPARSEDGYRFKVGDKPVLHPTKEGPFALYEEQGVLDARVSNVDGIYYVCYDALSSHGYRLAIAKTEDFKTFDRVALVSEPDTKAGVLFPEKINGRYARLERPWDGGSIWLSYSNDLIHWGWSEVVLTPRGGFWDQNRVGVATPPIKLDAGWLFIYYGIKETSAGPLFRLGAALLDHKQPDIVVGRTNVPVLFPRMEYERIGDVPNLVFSCGAILEDDGEIKLYYGASNSCICLGTTNVDLLLNACSESEKEY